MAGMRDDDATNDVEFEVSRLDDAAPNAAPLYTDPTEDAPASGGAAQHGASRIAPENNLRPHRRLLQAGVTGLAVALAVAVILVSFPGIGERLGGPLHPFAPTPTVPPGSDIILLAHTVPWGELHLERPDLHPLYLGYRRAVSGVPPFAWPAYAVLCGGALLANAMHVERAEEKRRQLQTGGQQKRPHE